MRLHLPALPTTVLATTKYPERNARVTASLASLGFTATTLHVGDTGEPYWEYVKRDFAEVVAATPCPFLILEDDALPTDTYTADVEFPDDADLVYLGGTVNDHGDVSDLALPRWLRRLNLHKDLLINRRGTLYVEHDPTWLRPLNMYSAHALLFPNEAAKPAILAALAGPRQHDVCLARLQMTLNTYCPKQPLFYQQDGHNDQMSRDYFRQAYSWTLPRELLAQHVHEVFVETGIWRGNACLMAKELGFKYQFGIELDPQLAAAAQRRQPFATICCGTSVLQLRDVLARDECADAGVTLWLDAHGKDTVVRHEIKAIGKYRQRCPAADITVLIDDMDLFERSFWNSGYNYDALVQDIQRELAPCQITRADSLVTRNNILVVRTEPQNAPVS